MALTMSLVLTGWIFSDDDALSHATAMRAHLLAWDTGGAHLCISTDANSVSWIIERPMPARVAVHTILLISIL